LPRQNLRFDLGAGAPTGAAIDPGSGFFSWRPNEFQGGTNYDLSIIVRDSGSPPLTATQSFNVRVRNTLPDFVFGLGSTNLFMGETNSVPIELATSAELTDLAFVLEVDSTRLTGLTLQSLASAVRSSTVQPAGSNLFQVRLSALASDPLVGSITLARLGFNALSNLHSAEVRLRVRTLDAVAANGDKLANANAGDGRIFILGQEPILQLSPGSDGSQSLVLYGIPGHSYVLESTSTLSSPATWDTDRNLELTTSYAPLTLSGQTQPIAFYRARADSGPRLKLTIRQEGENLCIEWPLGQVVCSLQETTSLSPPVVWSPLSISPEVLPDRHRVLLRPGATRYLRLSCGDQ
jgi:hypothetical protein